jgi:uncharacterized protein YvpB
VFRRRSVLAALVVLVLSPANSAAQTSRLSVPLHRQEHPLSCEAAALEMALATLGVQVSEDDLLARLARDPTPRMVLPDGSVTWGDPDQGFVGNWDGTFALDGYGVYEGPIADLARAYGFYGSLAVRGADPSQLYAAVRAGDPVVVWMPYAGQVRGRGAWMTPAGVEVDYVVTEHAVVLAGVGDSGVLYADPYTARLQQMSYADFEAATAELENRAVIVRSD